MEFISAGKPIVAFPHFGDQPTNAKLIEKRGIGMILLNKERKSKHTDQHISYEEPGFDAQKVNEIFTEILVTKKDFYLNNMLKMQAISRAADSRNIVARVVE